jgi:pyrroline-5-carboxylate reductase
MATNSSKAFRFKVGFVGAGNMAEAICRSLIQEAFYKPTTLAAFDPSEERRKRFGDELGVYINKDNAELVERSENILLAVKPQVMEKALSEIKPAIGPGQTVISIAAGISTHYIETTLDRSVPVIRVMPNTPLMVGTGTVALCKGKYATDAHLEFARSLFASSAVTLIVDESQIDAVTAVSGSGPAYFFYLVEAMAQAGVELGLCREDALKLSANTALGSAKMMMQLPDSPEVLRKKVTSPAGTTEAAIKVMDQANMKQTIVEALHAAAKRSKELGK